MTNNIPSSDVTSVGTDVNSTNAPNADASVSSASQTTDSVQKAETNPTNTTMLPKRRRPDPRFVWGSIAILAVVAVCGALSCFSSGKANDTTLTFDSPTPPPSPQITVLPETKPVVVDPEDVKKNPEQYSPEAKDNVFGKSESGRVFEQNPIARTDDQGVVIDNVPEGVKNNNPSRVLIDDEGIVASYFPFGESGPKRYVLCGQDFFTACHGRYRAPDDKNPQKSRFAAKWEEATGYHFYVMPECMLDHRDINDILKTLATKKDDEATDVTLTIKLVMPEIKQKAADAINTRYQLNAGKKVTTTDIELVPVDEVRVFVRTNKVSATIATSYEGQEVLNVRIHDTVRNLRDALQQKTFGLELQYAISGHSFKKNLQEQALYGMMSSNIMHGFYRVDNRTIKSLQEEFDFGLKAAGKALVKVVSLGGSQGIGVGRSKFSTNDDEYIEENDLNSVYTLFYYRGSGFEIEEFESSGKDKMSISLPNWRKIYGNPVVVPFDEESQEFVQGDSGVPQETIDNFNEYFKPAVLDALKNIPTTSPGSSKSLPAPYEFTLDTQLGFGKSKRTVDIRKGLKVYHVTNSKQEMDAQTENVEVKTETFSRWVNVRAITVYTVIPAEYEQRTLVLPRPQRILYSGSIEDMDPRKSEVANSKFIHTGDQYSLGSVKTNFVLNMRAESTDQKINLHMNAGISNSSCSYILDTDFESPLPGDFYQIGTVVEQYDPYLGKKYFVPAKLEIPNTLIYEDKAFLEGVYNHAKRDNPEDNFEGHQNGVNPTEPVRFQPNYGSLFSGTIEMEGEHRIKYATKEPHWWQHLNGANDYHDECITKDKVSLSLFNAQLQIPYVVKIKDTEIKWEQFHEKDDSVYFEFLDKDAASPSTEVKNK